MFAGAPFLCLLLRGVKWTTGLLSCCCLPITMAVMRQLKGALADDPHIASQDKLMLWSAFTLAFFALLRNSEFTSPSSVHFNLLIHLFCSDISFTSAGLLLLQLKSSKLIPSGWAVPLRSLLLASQSVQCGQCAVTWFTSFQAIPSPFISSQQGNFSPGTK